MSESALERLSRETWQRLADAKRLGIRLGEETITDLLSLDLLRTNDPRIRLLQTSRYKERSSGTDFEWWIGQRGNWRRYAVQAKKLGRNGRYESLTHRVRGRYQLDVLERYSLKNRAQALYCFYNSVNASDAANAWHCCKSFKANQLGVTVSPVQTVRPTLKISGTKNFKYIHSDTRSLPWRCLVNCPKRSARSPTTPQVFANQDNVHDVLPPYLESGIESGERIELPGDEEDLGAPKRILIVQTEI